MAVYLQTVVRKFSRYLLATVIFHDCTQNCRFKGDPGRLAQIPPHKTLFRTGPDRGLPIGNLTSQFFANVYLNELDHFVKHSLKCRHYIRQVNFFKARLPGHVLLFRVGSFFEIYGRQACETATVLRCTVKPKSRGMANVAGFPQTWRQWAVNTLLRHGYPAAVVEQAGAGKVLR